jgi:phospho-N-acetylmuramoyl-pentapeptide-transferase
LCGIFLIEELSVIMQVWYVERHKNKNMRLFKMTPLHHHFTADPEKLTWDYKIKTPDHRIPEAKIVMRFFLVSILLAALTFVTLKIR